MEDKPLSNITASTLLAMASAMDSVVGPMSMIPTKNKGRQPNKYAGMASFSGTKEIERRKLSAEKKGVARG